jgi:DNA sulfur modification protein DndC
MLVTEKLVALHRDRIDWAVAAGALFIVNHSGGKDSQATYAVISKLVPADQIAVVHCDLGEVEWDGALAHIEDTTSHPVNVTKAIWKDGSEKTLLGAIEDRGMFPAGPQRYCTSDMKRGPAEKVIRRLSKTTGRKVIISCFGYRREESDARAKKTVWADSPRNSKAGRVWIDFSPILDLTTAEVFEVIADAGQEPHHAYANGNQRMSCVFCIFGSVNDLRNGAAARPELFRKYVELEQRIGHTLFNGQSLEEKAGITINQLTGE